MKITLTSTLILTAKKMRMTISHFCFILLNLKIFGEKSLPSTN